MDTTALVELAKRRPYLVGGVAAASAGAVGWVWWQRRGGSPASQSQDLGRIVQIQSTESAPPASPLPSPVSSNKPPAKSYAGDPATLPKGMICPGGSVAVYDKRAGTYGQTTGAVVCRFADGRTLPPRKAKR